MSDTILTFDNVADSRWDPWTSTYNPRQIGYGAEPAEVKTIPSTAPYEVTLFEGPQENTPSTTQINLVSGGALLQEVSKTTTPANLQYRVNYDERGLGRIEFNAGQAGEQVTIKYYGLGTLLRKDTIAVKLSGLASYVFASVDSSQDSKDLADYVVAASEDFGALLNTVSDSYSSTKGTIWIMAGSYYCDTSIAPRAGVNIIGNGYDTVLIKNANYAVMVDLTTNGAQNILLKDFRLSPQGGTYTGAAYYGIEGRGPTDYSSKFENISINGSYSQSFYNCANVVDCTSTNCLSSGFELCNKLSRCRSIASGAQGFNSCDYLDTCYSFLSTLNGFNQCDYVGNCESYQNTEDGYSQCKVLTTCKAYDNSIYGFFDCDHLSSCESFQNTNHGYSNCQSLAACESNDNSQDGFASCEVLTSCLSVSNTVNGFSSCLSMGFNRATGNGTNYPGGGSQNYADSASVALVADTATGGYNS